MSIFWFALFIFLLLIEIITINLVSIWFAIAALVCGFLAIFIDNVFIQIIVFIIISVFTLLLTKPFLKKLKVRKVEPMNSDRVLGKEAIVTKRITKDELGFVKVLSMTWTAMSDEVIEKGSKVIVEAIDGVKLIVKKKEEEE